METSSLVSKAKTAFHSAAAKAEKVLTDIKADLKTDHHSVSGGQSERDLKCSREVESQSKESDDEKLHGVKHSRKKPPLLLGRRQDWRDWQDRLKNVRIGKAAVEEKEKIFAFNSNVSEVDEYLDQLELENSSLKGFEEACHVKKDVTNASDMNNISPTAALKQLAIALEYGKKYKSIKDLLTSARDSSPVKERGGLSFSVMKSIVLREKEDKLTSDYGDDDEILLLSQLLFDTVRHLPGRTERAGLVISSLPREIHGAPADGFVVRLSEIIGSIKTLRKMALVWLRVVEELRRLWSDGQPVPRVPLDDNPDLNSCLLHQQLQVINCCISRKRRHAIASESLNSVMSEAGSNSEDLVVSSSKLYSNSILYAKVNNGDFILRLGAAHPSEGLTMLETGEPIYSPITQEGPILTEDFIKETEELVLRTGSVGAGCSQLLSDMQAFKAANPGCILEDFVRWHSPPDWTRADQNDDDKDTTDIGESSSRRGQLSSRMQKEGNLWRELWETAKPLPAVRQTPLYDEDLAVEGILNSFEEISPNFLFQQLFISLLGSGLAIAEGTLPSNSILIKLFYECKEYVIATCQGDAWIDNVDDLCQVYETVERILANPEDCLSIMKHSEDPLATDEPKRRFKKLSLNFGGKDRQFLKKPGLFSKKPPKPSNAPQVDGDENDWTVV